MSQSGDDNIAGGDACRPRRPGRGSSSVQLHDDACHLCLEGIDGTSSGKLKQFKGATFHAACWNGVRAYRRIFHGPALADCDRRMAAEPEEWRAEVAPLVIGEGEDVRQKRQKHRETIRDVRDTVTYDKSERLEDQLILNKRRFKTYKGFWDKQASDSASSEFEYLLEEQENMHSTQDVPMVAIDDNPKSRRARGRKVERPTGSSSGGQSEQQGRDRDRDGLPASRERTRDRRRRDKADPPLRHHGRSRRRDDRARDASRLPSPAPSSRASSVRRVAALTPECLEKHNGSLCCDSDDEEVAPPPSAKKAKSVAPSEAASRSGGSGSTLNPLSFMREKAKVRDELQKAIDGRKAKSSTWSKVQASAAKLSDAQRRQLDKDPARVIIHIDSAMKTVSSLLDELEGLRSSALQDFIGRAENALEQVQVANNDGEAELQAIQFLLQEKNKEVKAEANSARYIKTRLANRLTSGGYSKVFARTVVNMIDNIQKPKALDEDDGKKAKALDEDDDKKAEGEVPAEAKFDPSALMVFSDSGDDIGKALVTAIAEYGGKAADTEVKTKSLLDNMAKKTDWQGAMVRLTMDNHDFPKEFDFHDKLSEEGAAGTTPWLVACRPFAWRVGPHAWPLPGLGSFVKLHKLPEGLEAYLVMIPMGIVISEGVALKDMQAFLETDTGAQASREHGKVVKLTEGSVAWVPYATFCLPVVVCEDKADDKKASKIMQTAVFWSWVPFVADLAKEVDSQLWTAISKWNSDHFAKNSSLKLWADRSESFRKFLKLMEQ